MNREEFYSLYRKRTTEEKILQKVGRNRKAHDRIEEMKEEKFLKEEFDYLK